MWAHLAVYSLEVISIVANILSNSLRKSSSSYIQACFPFLSNSMLVLLSFSSALVFFQHLPKPKPAAPFPLCPLPPAFRVALKTLKFRHHILTNMIWSQVAIPKPSTMLCSFSLHVTFHNLLILIHILLLLVVRWKSHPVSTTVQYETNSCSLITNISNISNKRNIRTWN